MSLSNQARAGRRPVNRVSAALPSLVAMVGLVAACNGTFTVGPTSTPTPTRAPAPTVSLVPATPSPAPTLTPSAGPAAFPRNPAPIVAGDRYEQAIDPADFVRTVDNPFFPLAVGTTWVYGGDERVEVTVLPTRKVFGGIVATVVQDRVFVDGELVEDTLDWYAQDRDGNVWYFGEQTAEYENGEVTSRAGSWEAGVNGAVPGIIMLAEPRVGDAYRQEFLEGEAEDLAECTALTGSITVPVGSWSGSDVLVTEEWTPLEPTVRERKTYARGIGLVETRTIEGGDEVTSLKSITLP